MGEPEMKKTKKTPLRNIVPGEGMIDIRLVVLASDDVRNVRDKHKVLNIICSDGYDYVTIGIWDNNIERLEHQLGDGYLVIKKLII